MSTVQALRNWVKAGERPIAAAVKAIVLSFRTVSIPVVPGVHKVLYFLHRLLSGSSSACMRVLWYTPLFQSRLTEPAERLYLYGGLPLVLGPVEITLGHSVRMSAQTTIAGRTVSKKTPVLKVGDNVDIGWQTTIAVGSRVEIGNNVRIAGRAFLAGYPGHPIDAQARAAGQPDTDEQVGDIVLEDDVWLATNVTVSAGVRIGAGTIIAAGSVVTHDLPPGILAAGVPARAIRSLAVDRRP